MIFHVSLKKIGDKWEFSSEADLEDCVWQHLPELLGLKPLARQHQIQGQRCDILAISETNQLVIIELKNLEDRYIVQQLTRYYDVLIKEKPFLEKVDYNCPIQIIAVAPSFHRDSFIDIKYNCLSFKLLQCKIIEFDSLYLQLIDIETGKTYHQVIFEQDINSNKEVPNPSKKMQNYLNQYDLDKQAGILRIRHKILTYDPRLEEIATNGSIKYGNGRGKTHKLCAEFCFDNKKNIVLFLWLPLKNLQSDKVARARLWTDWQEIALVEGYVSTGIGAEINNRKRKISTLINKIIENQDITIQLIYISKGVKIINGSNRTIVKQYCKEHNLILRKLRERKPVIDEELALFHLIKDESYRLNPSPYRRLDELLNLALEKWKERI